MKKFLFILLFFPLISSANEGAFVLVDVSKSFPDRAIKMEAKQIILDLLQGKFNKQLYGSQWKYSSGTSDQKINSIMTGNVVQLLKNDDILFLIPFGDKSRYANFQWLKIGNYPNDMTNFFNNNFPEFDTDGKTFINIAQSMTVILASWYTNKEFYIFQMSDQLSDQTGSKSVFDQFEIEMMKSWNNHVNSVINNVLMLERSFVSGGTTYRYFVSVIKVTVLAPPKIDNIPDGLLPPPGTQSTGSSQTTATGTGGEIKLTTYSGGKRNTPVVIKQENLSISWACENCPSDVTYVLQVQGIDGNKYKDRRNTSSNSLSLNLKSGTYKIFVSGESASGTSVGSDVTYVEVDTGSASWLLWLLLIGGLAIGLILYLQKARQNKNRKATSEY